MLGIQVEDTQLNIWGKGSRNQQDFAGDAEPQAPQQRVLNELCGGPKGIKTMRFCLSHYATFPAAVGTPSYPHHTFVGVHVAMNQIAFSFSLLKGCSRSTFLGWLKASFTVLM